MNLFACFLILIPSFVFGQRIADLQRAGNGPIPETILSTRVFVFTDYTFTEKEINTIHAGLVKTGVDAVGYTQVDKLFAGADITQAFIKYLQNREVGNLVFAFKNNPGYELMIVPLVVAENNTLTIPASVWKTQDRTLDEALMTLYRTALAGKRKQNLLINEVPEIDLTIPLFTGNRNELFAYDLKVDNLAVQKFGDEKIDSELEEIMKNYPFKYKLVEANVPEAELRKQGSLYLLRHIHTRGPAAKQLLGYDMSKGESALVSVTYPNGQEQIKTIAADVEVHKFYVRHIEFGHVFLGPKWDADTTWQQALQNFIKGLRNEMKIN
ncbi:MAG: hypothetical protein HRU69_04535 [Flammeovirgaceae bacterium]|nr:MAG: hypothetical protein HRU69_04535 [Flammeovirgaceae bacterium]